MISESIADPKTQTKTKMNTQNNTIGTLAFFDSFGGLIPCKVQSIKDSIPVDHALRGRSSFCTIRAKVTATRGAYLKGDEIESTALHIVPRSHASRRKYGARIIGGYTWEAAE